MDMNLQMLQFYISFKWFQIYIDGINIMIDQICQKCEINIEKEVEKKKTQSRYLHSKVSLGFLYHLALDLQFSFQSIALVADFVHLRNSKKFEIKLLKIMDNQNCEIPDQHYDENLVQIKFNGNPLSSIQAQHLASSFYSKVQGGMQLVISMFGIGKTGLIISNNGVQKSVVMFSVDDRVNPNYFKDQNGLIYIQNVQTNQIINLNGKLLEKIISGGLKIYHPHPQKVLQCGVNETKILIFHPKIFVSSNKLMFYQIRESNFGHDIDTHYNPQKIQFLNKIGYQMSIHSEFRLSCYLSCLYLEPKFTVCIGETQQQTCNTTYLKQLEGWKQNGGLVKINDVKFNGAIRVELYETTDKYFSKNNGILLYWKGRLINRFNVQFGRMIQQKFYKKRFRSPPRNIWKVAGIIELDHRLFTPNLLKNKFVNTFEYRRFVKDLYMFLENSQRKTNAIVIQNEPGQQQKSSSSESYNPQPRKRVKVMKKDQNLQ